VVPGLRERANGTNARGEIVMDGRDWIALLPFWLLVAPPVLAILSTLMDGTMRRERQVTPAQLAVASTRRAC
jgi:hypothetical protein